MDTRESAAIEAVAALDDPQRRRLYLAVREARHPVTRVEAAAAVDISSKLAAFHLEKLVETGLLEVVTVPVESPRPVGRTPKRYQPAAQTVSVSVPRRAYQELATVLVLAAETQQSGESAAEARYRVARGRGRQLAGDVEREELRGRLGAERALAFVESVLIRGGFEPYRSGADGLRLATCPFHPVTACAPALVCDINVAYIGGLLEGLGVDSLRAVLRPREGECCVEISNPAS